MYQYDKDDTINAIPKTTRWINCGCLGIYYASDAVFALKRLNTQSSKQ